MNKVLVFASKNEGHAQIYWITGETNIEDTELSSLCDRIDTDLWINPTKEWLSLNTDSIELISFLPGVTDNPAKVFEELLTYLPSGSGKKFSVHSGEIIWKGQTTYFNNLIQKKVALRTSELSVKIVDCPVEIHIPSGNQVSYYQIQNLSNEELLQLSNESKWALSLEEMKTIQQHFSSVTTKNLRAKNGLQSEPTDVECEVLAQSWSEHCKHKIFGATIHYQDAKENFTVKGVYPAFIKDTTKTLAKNWAISVFKDNAGVVDWDANLNLCIKVETHNSPSALDPYGGALTGILGVNRDILGCGMGFRPIANTDVFCVGEWDEKAQLPNRLLHPKTILKGIHKGVQDGGNKSGIPTVNGAIHFDENFTGKPLVYCGTIGVAPKEIGNFKTHEKYHCPGDYVVMAGGRVGLDGIHGATMSSIILNESVPKTMVQIGDPFTQKKLMDFLMEARNLNLYTSITDNGAGGLSSSVGEMAERTHGVKIDLAKVPLKYPGLKPWEILVSESQERMTLAVTPAKWPELLALAKTRGVEVSHVGEFTDHGHFEISYQEKCVGLLSLDFLHGGLPPMELTARWDGIKEIKPTFKKEQSTIKPTPNSHQEILKVLMSDRTIASKWPLVRQYDHEVQAATFVKPYAANDGGVIALKQHGGSDNKAIAISSGLCPQFSHIDTKFMAQMSVDECYRQQIALGANPEKIAMTDNFCWPDPLPGKNNPDFSHKLAQLVRAGMGLQGACLAYKVPLISGKDSMKNDYVDENVKISVPPTLLMTGMGYIENYKDIKKSAIKEAHQQIYLLGTKFDQKYFGHMMPKYFDVKSILDFEWNMAESFSFYQLFANNRHTIESCHDVSEGGILVALCESLFTNKLGLKSMGNKKDTAFWYSEYPSQFIVSVSPDKTGEFEKTFHDYYTLLGVSQKQFVINLETETIDLSEVEKNWSVSWE